MQIGLQNQKESNFLVPKAIAEHPHKSYKMGNM